MAYVELERLLDKTDYSIYKLAILASKRALEIAEGQPKLVSMNLNTKPSSVALEEIAQGKIIYGKVKA